MIQNWMTLKKKKEFVTWKLAIPHITGLKVYGWAKDNQKVQIEPYYANK